MEEKMTSKAGVIRRLVRLANNFVRLGARGSLGIGLPLHTSIEILGKGYRKMSLPASTRLITEQVIIGKRDGLIFRFSPETPLARNGENVAAIECKWEDVIDAIPELYERLNEYYDGEAIKVINDLDEEVKAKIVANPAMHKILKDGLRSALEDASVHFKQEEVESNELFGQWG